MTTLRNMVTLTEAKIRAIRNGQTYTLDEHYALCVLAEEAIMMRRALEFIATDEKMTIEHQRGFAHGTLQGIDAMAEGRAAAEPEAKVKTWGYGSPFDGDPIERCPDGTINNCATANGFPSVECQMCGGTCPDAERGR